MRSAALLATALAATTLVGGCSNSSSSGSSLFKISNTAYATAAVSPVTIKGTWMFLLADEATQSTMGAGTDLNADGDTVDAVAIVYRIAPVQQYNLATAAISGHIVGDQIYLVVSEAADNNDWSGDGMMDDTVLLHWNITKMAPTYVDDVDTSSPRTVLATETALYYASVPMAPAVGESSLRFIDVMTPTVPTTVLHNIGAAAAQAVTPGLLLEDEGLIACALDETVEGVDLNGDGDMTDAVVLGLLDSTNPAAMLLSTGLPLQTTTSPFRALSDGAGDWQIAFLVDEASQGSAATGLNDHIGLGFPLSWLPSQCMGLTDTDTTDQVLHTIGSFTAWVIDPITNPPANTGLAGYARVACVPGYVATLAAEADDLNCDLNGDGDMADTMARWAPVASPLSPYVNATNLVASIPIPGGTFGFSDLNGRFITVVDEAADGRDHDGDGLMTRDLVAWLNPAAGTPQWTYDHSGSAGIQSVGASSMFERKQRDYLLVGFQEEPLGVSINSGGDADTLDSVPTFARFKNSNPNDLDFPGPAIAIDTQNPGISIARSVGTYRVDEAEDNRDWNSDGDKNDIVLWRTTLSKLASSNMGIHNTIAGSSVQTDGLYAAAFLGDESAMGVDYNKDGDITDFVVRWFRIGS